MSGAAARTSTELLNNRKNTIRKKGEIIGF